LLLRYYVAEKNGREDRPTIVLPEQKPNARLRREKKAGCRRLDGRQVIREMIRVGNFRCPNREEAKRMLSELVDKTMHE
jgi:hypothetical protein